jgi:hypothetical protein
MQGNVALGRSQFYVKVISVDLEDRIRALIKTIVETTDLASLNALGAELQELLALERTFRSTHRGSERTL